MASSSKEVNLCGKRNPEDDDLETKPFLKKHKDEEKKEETPEGLADSLQHKSDQANLISLKEEESTVEGRDDTPDFVEALEKKDGECLLDRKIYLKLPKLSSSLTLPTYQDFLPRQEDETPPADFAEEVLFVANLSPQTKILDIFGFCQDVGEVVSVRLIANHEGKPVGCAFVEFLSAHEAKKVLENKNGDYLHGHKIILMRGHGETPNFAEAVATSKKKTLFVAHLTPQTIISDIINFFKDVGQVVHVRLIVNHTGKHVGKGFVEFASAKEAENVRVVFLVIDEKYEDYLGQERDEAAVEGLAETPYFVEEARKKTLFVTNLPPRTSIQRMLYFFQDFEVVRVRLIVDQSGKHMGCGYFEFASANEAEKALEQRNGKSLRYHKIFLELAEIAPYPLQHMYKLAEKLW
ncbi:RNA recognition motif domain [Arabidopsis thaliana x Arabidopsis arenosa]|uniref:RNA recognition motif domain n=1 Tax=Arabidopsis thaliana x Arabidopsis arenosa TaxID=1240361 RepID=A0A8T2EZA2_9BRAS|nr:RNA recognition motif domain [Arabidopsis thaliana x Arabidopsis arenosa]